MRLFYLDLKISLWKDGYSGAISITERSLMQSALRVFQDKNKNIQPNVWELIPEA